MFACAPAIWCPTIATSAGIPFVGQYECWRETPLADGTRTGLATDWSGGGYDATSTGANRPRFFNNQAGPGQTLPSWRFEGSSILIEFLSTATMPAMGNTAKRYYYVVARFNGLPQTINGLFAGVNSGNTNIGDLYYGFVEGFTGRLTSFSRYAFGTTSMENLDTNYNPYILIAPDFYLFRLVLDGTNVRRTIGPAAYSDTRAQSTPAPNGSFSFILGNLSTTSAGNGMRGDIAAAFVGVELTTAQEAALLSYIFSKYGTSQ